MNTRTVDPRTVWAVLAMEAGIALPLISLPTQGDRFPGLAGPLLLLCLLPLGYFAVRRWRTLRDPSWRLLIGIGLALLTRAIVSNVPAPGLPGLLTWFARSLLPMAIGVGLWWRGGALCVAELTAADVRTEFSVLAVCMLAMLGFVRPFVLSDPLLLGGSVGVFAVGGLVATAMSRQDAAEAAMLRFGRTLATTTAVLPAGLAVLLVSVLRPELLGALWLGLARLIELALTPLGLLLAWLASLFPRGAALPAPLPVRPPSDFAPNPQALAELQDRAAWIGTVIAIALILAAGIAAILVVRLLLANWIGSPLKREDRRGPDLTVERSGTPRGDATAFWGWLMAWLRGRLAGRGAPRAGSAGGAAAEAMTADAWAAYQRLLTWAERQGLGRRPAETTGQLQTRLAQYAPSASEAVNVVTETYEWERYGEVHPAIDRLRRVREALRGLVDRP
jgi:hypothetical protein